MVGLSNVRMGILSLVEVTSIFFVTNLQIVKIVIYSSRLSSKGARKEESVMLG